MRPQTSSDVHRIRKAVERTRRLSDRVVGIGPFSLGLDGVLGWIPGVGAAYSVAAGGLLLFHATRLKAPPSVIARMAAFLAADTLTDVIPIPLAPAVVDMVFTGHKWAADTLLKEMDRTLYYPGGRAEAERDPEFHRTRDERRPERIVFLSD